MPTLFILAGPNGAGKTTASQTILPEVFNTYIFINADIIAAQLNPAHPESVAFRTGRIMLERIQQTLAARKTFAIETTQRVLTYFVIFYYINCREQFRLIDAPVMRIVRYTNSLQYLIGK